MADYESLPVVAFRFSDEFQKENPDVEQKWIQTLLRAKGWIVPNYNLPPSLEKVDILRVVVRENLSEDSIERLVCDIMEITEDLMKNESSSRHLAQLASPNDAAKRHGGYHESHNSQFRSEVPESSKNIKLGVKATGYARQC